MRNLLEEGFLCWVYCWIPSIWNSAQHMINVHQYLCNDWIREPLEWWFLNCVPRNPRVSGTTEWWEGGSVRGQTWRGTSIILLPSPAQVLSDLHIIYVVFWVKFYSEEDFCSWKVVGTSWISNIYFLDHLSYCPGWGLRTLIPGPQARSTDSYFMGKGHVFLISVLRHFHSCYGLKHVKSCYKWGHWGLVWWDARLGVSKGVLEGLV